MHTSNATSYYTHTTGIIHRDKKAEPQTGRALVTFLCPWSPPSLLKFSKCNPSIDQSRKLNHTTEQTRERYKTWERQLTAGRTATDPDGQKKADRRLFTKFSCRLADDSFEPQSSRMLIGPLLTFPSFF
mmetsp:Transcript_26450/g.51945  ORF Transcript_26450/g.51945 Transcript_26450/m.51945 type:complete len:129 (+) Transcript_26450:316-702(+)